MNSGASLSDGHSNGQMDAHVSVSATSDKSSHLYTALGIDSQSS